MVDANQEERLLREALPAIIKALDAGDYSGVSAALRKAGFEPNLAMRVRQVQAVFDSGELSEAGKQAEAELVVLQRQSQSPDIGTKWNWEHIGTRYPLPPLGTGTPEDCAASFHRIIARSIERQAVRQLGSAGTEYNVITRHAVDNLILHGVGSQNPLLAEEIVRRFEREAGRDILRDPNITVWDSMLRCFAETFDFALQERGRRMKLPFEQDPPTVFAPPEPVDRMAMIVRDGAGDDARRLAAHVTRAVTRMRVYPPSRPLAEVVERACDPYLQDGPVTEMHRESVSAMLRLWSSVVSRDGPSAEGHFEELLNRAGLAGFPTLGVNDHLAPAGPGRPAAGPGSLAD